MLRIVGEVTSGVYPICMVSCGSAVDSSVIRVKYAVLTISHPQFEIEARQAYDVCVLSVLSINPHVRFVFEFRASTQTTVFRV